MQWPKEQGHKYLCSYYLPGHLNSIIGRLAEEYTGAPTYTTSSHEYLQMSIKLNIYSLVLRKCLDPHLSDYKNTTVLHFYCSKTYT